MMPSKNSDLYRNVPDSAAVVLLFIDVINDMEFEGGEALAEQTMAIAGNLAALRRRAKSAGVPIVYVNDNFGKRERADRVATRFVATRSRRVGPPLRREGTV